MNDKVTQQLHQEDSIKENLEDYPTPDESSWVGEVNLSDNNAKDVHDANYIYNQFVLDRRHVDANIFLPFFA